MKISDLNAYGFNVESALELCINDEEIYKEILETALEEGLEKVPLIEELAQKKDYTNYIIEVHGLKNVAIQIGCTKLSDMAKRLEFAGKEGKFYIIDEETTILIIEYRRILDVLAKMFG